MNPKLFYPFGPLQNQHEKTDVIYFAKCGWPHTVIDQCVFMCDDWIEEAQDDEVFKFADSYQYAYDISDGLRFIVVTDDPILNRPGYVCSLPMIVSKDISPKAIMNGTEGVSYAERFTRKHLMSLQHPKRKAVFL